MKTILINEIYQEMPNAQALGAFNKAVKGAMIFGSAKNDAIKDAAKSQLMSKAAKYDKLAKNTNSNKKMNTYMTLANRARSNADKLVKS